MMDTFKINKWYVLTDKYAYGSDSSIGEIMQIIREVPNYMGSFPWIGEFLDKYTYCFSNAERKYWRELSDEEVLIYKMSEEI
jgi:hypothetical protein